jgi:putative mRNA 3-end processing factor
VGESVRARADTRQGETVIWRDGVHICDTPIWCDAHRAQEVCFVSAAHAVSPSRHGQLIGTATTLSLLPSGGDGMGPESRLPIPYDRPFTLGTRRLELVRSGHAVGSASLSITVDGQKIFYAGAVCPDGAGLGGAADCRPCDTLVISTDYGDPRFELPPRASAAAETLAFVREVLARGGVPVLFVSSPAKALDVLVALGEADISASGHRSFANAAQRVRASGVVVPPMRRANGAAPAGSALLWPAAARARLDAVQLPAHSRTALVSGAAAREEAVRAIRADAGFAWSNQADFRALVDYVEGAGAERVYTTGACARRFADAIAKPGRAAAPLAPPEQLALF